MENKQRNTELQTSVEYCLNQIERGLETFTNRYPADASINGIYPAVENIGWTTGFWTGMLWLAYEISNKKLYREVALQQVQDFYHRIKNEIGVEHHDMGFLYSPSCVAAYKITGDNTAKKAAILAADKLCSRFQEKGQFIQAWGELGVEDNYRLIIDCLLNLPLLFWASKVTGEARYREIAVAHLNSAVDLVIREDGSTYHTYFFDPKTGEPKHGVTHQGYSDSSIWARGQAWGIYGLALAYKHTGQPELVDKFLKVTELFFKHLPDDNVPAWDMIFTDTETQKDTSAAPIVVCGILEMNKLVRLPNREQLLQKSKDMMHALGADYLTSDIPNSNGILKHAVYSIPHNLGVDECNIWGDYYYMEALMRMMNPDWSTYWD